MNLSQKCQYAIRSLLELAKFYGEGPVRISKIADKQAIPPRFLENILNELKSTNMIESRRGAHGGYMLIKRPDKITVGEIIRLIDGPLDPVQCIGDKNNPNCPLRGKCALINLWKRAKSAIEEVYDSTTFADLVEEENQLNCSDFPDYCI